MAKPPDDPAGPVQTICISLSPTRLDKLDQIVADRNSNRSAMIGKLIDRATHPVTATTEDPVYDPLGASQEDQARGCPHTKFDVLGGGLKRCRDCTAINANGTWKSP